MDDQAVLARALLYLMDEIRSIQLDQYPDAYYDTDEHSEIRRELRELIQKYDALHQEPE